MENHNDEEQGQLQNLKTAQTKAHIASSHSAKVLLS